MPRFELRLLSCLLCAMLVLTSRASADEFRVTETDDEIKIETSKLEAELVGGSARGQNEHRAEQTRQQTQFKSWHE